MVVISESKGKKKVKVKLSLCLTKTHKMKTNWGTGGIAPCILDFGTAALSPTRVPGTLWVGG